ncbi:MAG: hypothetical protein IAF94_03105 [Pirellulaceae bacterium]|nr:hypothetical protein [Pirellulaceae bacterium]
MGTGQLSKQISTQPFFKGPVAEERAERLNPYASPVIPSEPVKPLLSQDKWPLLKIHVVDVQKQAMRRRILLAGDVEAEICYDGWVPNELVTVNGLKRFPGSIVIFAIVSPMILFEVETSGHRLPAAVHVAATFSLRTFLRLTRFQINIAGRLIYCDDGK